MQKENLTILGNRVVIEEIKEVEEKKTESGIVYGGTAFESLGSISQVAIGTVIYTGPGKRDTNGVLIPMTVKVGDKVYYNRLEWNPLHLGVKVYAAATEDAVIAIIND